MFFSLRQIVLERVVCHGFWSSETKIEQELLVQIMISGKERQSYYHVSKKALKKNRVQLNNCLLNPINIYTVYQAMDQLKDHSGSSYFHGWARLPPKPWSTVAELFVPPPRGASSELVEVSLLFEKKNMAISIKNACFIIVSSFFGRLCCSVELENAVFLFQVGHGSVVIHMFLQIFRPWVIRTINHHWDILEPSDCERCLRFFCCGCLQAKNWWRRCLVLWNVVSGCVRDFQGRSVLWLLFCFKYQVLATWA